MGRCLKVRVVHCLKRMGKHRRELAWRVLRERAVRNSLDGMLGPRQVWEGHKEGKRSQTGRTRSRTAVALWLMTQSCPMRGSGRRDSLGRPD